MGPPRGWDHSWIDSNFGISIWARFNILETAVPLPTAYQVRLTFYGIDATLDGPRRDVWALLEPEFDRILDDYLGLARVNAPLYAAVIVQHAAEIKNLVRSYNAKLFL